VEKNKQRGIMPKAPQPREVIQMDTIDFGDLSAFTAIVIFSKEADTLVAPELTAAHGCRFFHQGRERRFGEDAWRAWWPKIMAAGFPTRLPLFLLQTRLFSSSWEAHACFRAHV
jgi:hypothetical protein